MVALEKGAVWSINNEEPSDLIFSQFSIYCCQNAFAPLRGLQRTQTPSWETLGHTLAEGPRAPETPRSATEYPVLWTIQSASHWETCTLRHQLHLSEKHSSTLQLLGKDYSLMHVHSDTSSTYLRSIHPRCNYGAKTIH